MRYWEHRLKHEPLFEAIKACGSLEAYAKSVKRKVEDVTYDVAVWRYRHDTETLAKERLKIVSEGNLIPLVYNNGQKKIDAAIERQKIAGKPVRVSLLKARQFGGSTLFEAEVFKECNLNAMKRAMVIAHSLASAEHLRDMSQIYYDNFELPKPNKKGGSGDKLWKFKHIQGGKDVDSQLRIDTAEELSSGHSFSLQILHMSEIQVWRNAQVLIRGLFPTVQDTPESMIFMEGTGSGVGDFWYEFYNMTKESDVWEAVFVPWFEIEKYTLPFKDENERNEFGEKLTPEESLLYRELVPLESLHWRRLTLKEKFNGDEDSFRQQFPATEDEAFLSSGRPVFPAIKVREKIGESLKPIKTGYLEGSKNVKFVEDPKGYWEIWEEKEDIENLYCLGADVAEGKAVVPELGNRGGDFSCAKILRRDTREFVARLHARIDPDVFADELLKAWKYWGCPLLIESNPGGSGNVVIRALKNYPGINLLRQRSLNKRHEDSKEEFGWKTMKDTKRLLIDELLENIRDENFVDKSKNFWYECSTYVRDEKGATNAQNRKYDDEVIANAITFQADKLVPSIFKPVKQVEEIPRDRDIDRPSQNITQASVMEDNYV